MITKFVYMGVILSKVTGALFEYVHFCTECSTWTFIKVKRVFGLFVDRYLENLPFKILTFVK